MVDICGPHKETSARVSVDAAQPPTAEKQQAFQYVHPLFPPLHPTHFKVFCIAAALHGRKNVWHELRLELLLSIRNRVLQGVRRRVAMLINPREFRSPNPFVFFVSRLRARGTARPLNTKENKTQKPEA